MIMKQRRRMLASVNKGINLIDVPLSTPDVWTWMTFTENGTDAYFTPIQHNYQNSGRCLIMRCFALSTKSYWGRSSATKYAGSTIDNYVSNTYLNLLDSNIQNNLQAVAIPCYNGSGSVTTIDRKIFLLSGTEIGLSNTSMYVEGTQIPYFSSVASRRCIDNSNTMYVEWWLRSISSEYSSFSVHKAFAVDNYDTYSDDLQTVAVNSSQLYIHVFFTLPSTFKVKQNADGTYSPF